MPERRGGLDSLEAGHPRLERLSVSRSRFADLGWASRLRLTSLAISGGLTSLSGATPLASTVRRLSLDSLPNLPSVAGIEDLGGLGVVRLSGLRNVTTLDWAARLPNLRLLDVFEQAGIESLRPLAGHPSLEFLTFGRVKDLDLEPLARIPNLRLFLTGSYRWNRPLTDLPYLHELARDDPARAEYAALVGD